MTNTYCSTSGGTTCPPDPAVVSQTTADGGTYTFDYVVTSRSVTQSTVTDPRGNNTVKRFNGRNQLVSTVDALGQQTRMTRLCLQSGAGGPYQCLLYDPASGELSVGGCSLDPNNS